MGFLTRVQIKDAWKMINTYFKENNVGMVVENLLVLEEKLHLLGQERNDEDLVEIDKSLLHYRSLLKKSLKTAFDNIFETFISETEIDLSFRYQNQIAIGTEKPLVATVSEITSLGIKLNIDFVDHRDKLVNNIISNSLVCLKEINYVYTNKSEWKCQFQAFESASKMELLDTIISLISFLDVHLNILESSPLIR